jgi:hypothetical protein
MGMSHSHDQHAGDPAKLAQALVTITKTTNPQKHLRIEVH